MRVILFLITSLFAFGAVAGQCSLNFIESELIASVGTPPVKQKTIKEDGLTKRQYEFRNELSDEERLSDTAEENYKPQFYLTVYNPSCPRRVKIWFYEDNKNTMDLSNATFAGRAFKYLTGVEESIFENKMKRFSSVQHFESFDDNTDSKFIKIGNIYSIDVYFR